MKLPFIVYIDLDRNCTWCSSFFYDNICRCKVFAVLEVDKEFETILKYCVTVSTIKNFCQKVPLFFVMCMLIWRL